MEQEVKVSTSVKFTWTINNFSKLSSDKELYFEELYFEAFFTAKDACKELQDLWDEVEIMFDDDLGWLEPHVKSALTCFEKSAKVEKLMADLEENLKTLQARPTAMNADLEQQRKNWQRLKSKIS
ncbi:hypothetical protein PIB30_053833 [Stylosanthes scabra]|uniref:Uncharacterized protein n=1 Tax=Stylosanthes scabra TaxID=79078 RepID=A0ABU6TJU0_9FABA|nr:hypothetical protein [Stylosanthes scabra]